MERLGAVLRDWGYRQMSREVQELKEFKHRAFFALIDLKKMHRSVIEHSDYDTIIQHYMRYAEAVGIVFKHVDTHVFDRGFETCDFNDPATRYRYVDYEAHIVVERQDSPVADSDDHITSYYMFFGSMVPRKYDGGDETMQKILRFIGLVDHNHLGNTLERTRLFIPWCPYSDEEDDKTCEVCDLMPDFCHHSDGSSSSMSDTEHDSYSSSGE
eukprot:768147-Hanusia_phi.AAC.2